MNPSVAHQRPRGVVGQAGEERQPADDLEIIGVEDGQCRPRPFLALSSAPTVRIVVRRMLTQVKDTAPGTP